MSAMIFQSPLACFVLLQYFNEVPVGVSKRHDEPKTMVSRADGLNTVRGQALGNGPHVRRTKYHDGTLRISRRNAGEPCAGMDGEMHTTNIATVVQGDSRVFLIFQRQLQGVPVEIRQRSRVRADQKNGHHAFDEAPSSCRWTRTARVGTD